MCRPRMWSGNTLAETSANLLGGQLRWRSDSVFMNSHALVEDSAKHASEHSALFHSPPFATLHCE